MKRWERLTVGAIVLMVVIGIVYDVGVFVVGGVDATISRVVLQAACRHPIIPFAFGILCGHLFWPQRVLRETDNG